MSRPRTARLAGAALFCAALGVVAACGFTDFGTMTVADAPDGTGEAGAGANGESGATDGSSMLVEGGEIIVGASDSGDASMHVEGGPLEAGPPCPAVCTSCTGTTCNIECSLAHPCVGDVNCPAGVPCHVTCSAVDACSLRTISCTDATSCRVECIQAHACQTLGISCGAGKCRLDCTTVAGACVAVNLAAKDAAGLCLHCDQQGGFPDCQATDGTKPNGGRPCDLACNGGGCNANGNGLDGCSDVATCPP